jgi:hypothetical protein
MRAKLEASSQIGKDKPLLMPRRNAVLPIPAEPTDKTFCASEQIDRSR